MRKSMLYPIISLALVNIITIIFAIMESWSLGLIIFTYWCQSIIIGIFQWFKIRDLKNFSTKDFLINDRPVKPTEETKRTVLGFFPLHYGLFHFVYLTFVIQSFGWMGFYPVLIPVMLFSISHYISYKSNRESDSVRGLNIGSMMFIPYIRILPMHIIIFIASRFELTTITLVSFLLMKTLTDILTHLAEHMMYKGDNEKIISV